MSTNVDHIKWGWWKYQLTPSQSGEYDPKPLNLNEGVCLYVIRSDYLKILVRLTREMMKGV
jgi:hypothetical protein